MYHPQYQNPYFQGQQVVNPGFQRQQGQIHPGVSNQAPPQQQQSVGMQNQQSRPSQGLPPPSTHPPQNSSNQDWKTDMTYRQSVIEKIKEHIEKINYNSGTSDQNTAKKAADWEELLLKKANNKNDYEHFVVKLLQKLNDHNKVEKTEVNVPSPVQMKTKQENTDNSVQQQHQTIPQVMKPEDLVRFREQLEKCRVFLEPLKKNMMKIENVPEKRKEYERMKTLRQTLIEGNPSKTSLDFLIKSERALKEWSAKNEAILKNSEAGQDRKRDASHLKLDGEPICQNFINKLYDVSKSRGFYEMKSQNISFFNNIRNTEDNISWNADKMFTFKKKQFQFNEPVDPLKFDTPVHPKRPKSDVKFDSFYEGPPMISDVLKGELVRLPYRYKVTCDQKVTSSHQITSVEELADVPALIEISLRNYGSSKKVPNLIFKCPFSYPTDRAEPTIKQGDYDDESLQIWNEFIKRYQPLVDKSITQTLSKFEIACLQVLRY